MIVVQNRPFQLEPEAIVRQAILTEAQASHFPLLLCPASHLTAVMHIAFQSEWNGSPNVLRIGGTGPTQVTDTPAADMQPTWSATGQQLAFT